MNPAVDLDWKTTSFSSYVKKTFLWNLSFAAVSAVIFLSGRIVAEATLSAESYSALTAGIVFVMEYFGVGFLGLMTLFSSTSVAVALFARVRLKGPWSFVAPTAARGIVATTAFGWMFIHAVNSIS